MALVHNTVSEYNTRFQNSTVFSEDYYGQERDDIHRHRQLIMDFLDFSQAEELDMEVLKRGLKFLVTYFRASSEIVVHPDFTFSNYDGDIDITIRGKRYRILITIYDDVYVMAYSDVDGTRISMQTDDLTKFVDVLLEWIKLTDLESKIIFSRQ